MDYLVIEDDVDGYSIETSDNFHGSVEDIAAVCCSPSKAKRVAKALVLLDNKDRVEYAKGLEEQQKKQGIDNRQNCADAGECSQTGCPHWHICSVFELAKPS